MGNVIVLSILGGCVLLAVRSLLKERARGGCCGCSGNCAGCGRSCSK